jgi:hypothetical protein
MKALADTIEARQNKGERIAVLVPQKRIAFGLAKGLSEMGLHVETPKTYRGEDNSFDFTTPYPKIMPYPSAKGLTFDSILLPRLTPRSFGSISNDKAGNMLFVAISRATKWAYMSTVGGINLPFMKDAVSLDKSGVLTIRRREMTPDLFNTTGNVTQKKSTKTVEQIPDVTDFF